LSKPEWGTKRICQSCATKFYDFGRTPIVCPKCSAVFDPETLLKSRRNRPSAAAKPSKPAAVAPVASADSVKDADVPAKDDDTPDVPDDDDEDEAAIEDASELGEDDEETSKEIIPGKGGED
jgi:uncharacterized protein (TIGR02300 family)